MYAGIGAIKKGAEASVVPEALAMASEQHARARGNPVEQPTPRCILNHLAWIAKLMVIHGDDPDVACEVDLGNAGAQGQSWDNFTNIFPH